MGQLKLNGLPATYDAQLLTPKHDEMMKLLFNNKIINKLEKFSGIENEIGNISSRHGNITNIELTNTKIDLEVPLKTHKGFIIGIIDAVITFKYKITYLYDNKKCNSREETRCGIEIKPTINSVGEVMRQLKIYNDYLLMSDYHVRKKAKIVLFTQDETEREIFESQNIGYISLEEVGDLNE